MTPELQFELLSSKTRLLIASLLTTRPRTLEEMASKTGVSVQAVLKHLEKLDAAGILEKRSLDGRRAAARKVYSIKDAYVGDFSHGDLTVVIATRRRPIGVRSIDPIRDLDSLAEEALILRARVREQARKLGRSIQDLVDSEQRLQATVNALTLPDQIKMVIQTAYTEGSRKEAEDALSQTLGFRKPKDAIESAIGSMKRASLSKHERR